MLHQNYTNRFHLGSWKDSIKVLQIQNFASSFIRKQLTNLLFLQKKKKEIFFLFSVSVFYLFLSLFCLNVLPIYHPYPIQHRWPAPSYFFTIAPTFTASVPLFSISDSYPGNEVAILDSITMFLGHWWSYASLLPKGSPYSPTDHLCSLSVSHLPPPYPFLKSSYSSQCCYFCQLLTLLFVKPNIFLMSFPAVSHVLFS